MEIDNPNPYEIIVLKNEIFLKFIDFSIDNPKNKLLSIKNINNISIKQEKLEILEDKNILKSFKAKAILGIINIINRDYILFVKSSENVGKINDEVIYLISEVDFVEIPKEGIEIKEEKDIKKIKEGISDLLTLGFYYSFGFDLTNSLQNKSKIIYDLKSKNKNFNLNDDNTENKLKKIYITTKKKYFFNYNLYKKFINTETKEPIDYCFITPIICGYVGMFNYMINGLFFQFILITRRSQNFAGTRYNTRGINDDGNVANFCESEQILFAGDMMCSFSQLRGSAPVFFDQIGMRAKTDITRNKELSIQAFNKHLQEIGEDYHLIYFINLLNQNKSTEAPIIEEFETQIKFRKNNENIRYKFFDMQNECKKDDYSNIDNLINNISNFQELFNFFAEDIYSKKVYCVQNGTTRTNCLDCLDRTNVIETRISWLILENMFRFLKFDEKDIQYMFNKEEKFFTLSKNNTFKENFKDTWAQNGDRISIQYAGTASTITTVTKTGGHNLKGILKHGVATVNRFYQGTFEDKFTQECFDILLQKEISKNLLLIHHDSAINEKLLLRKNEYFENDDFFIFISNYNLSGKTIDNKDDIENLLTSYKSKNDLSDVFPDLYILGFQEIIDSSIVKKSNEEKKNYIKESIKNILLKIYKTENNDSYELMDELDNRGLYLLIFVKASCIKYIKNLDSKIIKPGIKRNKGSLLIRFNINDSSICLACNYFASHHDKYEEIKKEIIELLNTDFKKYPSLLFKDYDYYFVFGDLNMRLNKKLNEEMKTDLIKNHIKENNYDYTKFLEYDQFYSYQKEKDSIISEMAEDPIKFSPTFQFIIGKFEYEKKITPSWSDRIFYKKSSNTIPLFYNKCLFTYSNHHPVLGIYKIKVEKINEQKQESILNEIIKEKSINDKK